MARVTKAETDRDNANLKLRQLVEVVKQDREQRAKEIESLKREREEQVSFFFFFLDTRSRTEQK